MESPQLKAPYVHKFTKLLKHIVKDGSPFFTCCTVTKNTWCPQQSIVSAISV